jgi:hypothetical protein
MPHAFRGFASALALALCALPVACGSCDDSATPVPVDAGHDGTTEGGAPGGKDAGGTTDTGAATEGGGGAEAAADAAAGG